MRSFYTRTKRTWASGFRLQGAISSRSGPPKLDKFD